MLYTSLKKLEILLNNHNYNYTIKGNLIFNRNEQIIPLEDILEKLENYIKYLEGQAKAFQDILFYKTELKILNEIKKDVLCNETISIKPRIRKQKSSSI